MATSLDRLGWFYGGKAEQQFGFSPSQHGKALHIFLSGLTLLGAYFFAIWLYSFSRLLFSIYLLPGKSLRSFGQPSRTWAVITGASDGLGKEFALQLAKAGFSTLLISRTPSKLEAVAQEIKQKFNTPTKTLAMDFGANNDEDYSRLEALTANLNVGILINNVGLSHSLPTPFTETPLDEVSQIITINCLATLRVTQLIAQRMLPRKCGLILTMGSFGGLLPTPLLATYSGSKAFLQQWSSALAAEMADHNITVELVQSYLVATAMSKIRRATLMVPTPRMYVRAVLGKVGRTGGAQGFAYTSTPYWSHAHMQWIIGCLAGWNSSLALGINKRFHEGIRRRALKKKAEKEKGRGKIE